MGRYSSILTLDEQAHWRPNDKIHIIKPDERQAGLPLFLCSHWLTHVWLIALSASIACGPVTCDEEEFRLPSLQEGMLSWVIAVSEGEPQRDRRRRPRGRFAAFATNSFGEAIAIASNSTPIGTDGGGGITITSADATLDYEIESLVDWPLRPTGSPSNATTEVHAGWSNAPDCILLFERFPSTPSMEGDP